MKFSLQVLSKTQTQFWIRVFKLETQIAFAASKINEPGPRAQATVPVIAEYVVDPELKFIYALVLFIDALGLADGRGFVYGADPQGEAECYKFRDQLANDIMKQLKEQAHIDEVIVMPEGKEQSENEPSKPSDRL
ncbi:MAG TPA: hypothetical protein VH164_01300 [Ktedonobacteraceae bacterium]|jgi:hypothetical protein|nr:hypothetical protein [Ktedonobacteraceae bacterium]